MARFLSDQRLSEAIREVTNSKNIRCAVAFWGAGAHKELFSSKEAAQDARIICDLSMGGTNPLELKQLGAPSNAKLRHSKDLHAKLYLSDAGLVITSANASSRGIGFGEGTNLIECGTQHKPRSKVYSEAEKWFEALWEKSNAIDANILESAKLAWNGRQRSINPIGKASSSLLFKIAADPIAYRGIGVVFTSGEAGKSDVDEASKAAISSYKEQSEAQLSANDKLRLCEWPPEHLFTGWSQSEKQAWPETFLSVHRGARGAIRYYCYERFKEPVETSPNEWSVFASEAKLLQEKLGITKSQSARPKDSLLEKVFEYLDKSSDCNGHKLCESPMHLAELLDRVTR